MNIVEDSINVLNDLALFLKNIEDNDYKSYSDQLFNASLGQHCRHIIEFFQCLMEQQPSGKICYDLRKRNQLLENSTLACLNAIDEIIFSMQQNKENSELTLLVSNNIDSDNQEYQIISSSYYRELAFNIEHCIHHMAIIKIGMKIIGVEINLPENFGVAPSTLRHKIVKSN